MWNKIFRDKSKHPITGLNMILNLTQIEIERLNDLTGKLNEVQEASIFGKPKHIQPDLNHSELSADDLCHATDDLVHNALLESDNKPLPSTSSSSRLTSPGTSGLDNSTGSTAGDIDSGSLESCPSMQEISTRLV